MKTNTVMLYLVVLMALLFQSCVERSEEDVSVGYQSSYASYTAYSNSNSSNNFKIPLSSGENWEVMQSWGEHCQECDLKYPEGEDGYSYCEDSHTGEYTKYGWDFNLPGFSDKGKSVLASADGTAKTDFSTSWGYYVIIDHGNNICTRYAHMKENSITVTDGEEVCQGLKIGEIGDSGNSFGPHLHFQFESCDYEEPIAMGFDDGNGVPKCVKGSDVLENGVYTALIRSNVERSGCGAVVEGGCGKLKMCPLNSWCGNTGKAPFGDSSKMDDNTLEAAQYLWMECSISGKNDGKLHGEEFLTRAEALKIALTLFGLMGECNVKLYFTDVQTWDWFYEAVKCGVSQGAINKHSTKFYPNASITFAEAAKMLVETAAKKGFVEIKDPENGHFSKIKNGDWGYKYVETLYFYGAVDPLLVDKTAGQALKREQYVRMAAALSPCFCGNVRCSEGCSCDQKSFACVGSVGYESEKDEAQTASENHSKSGPEKSSASSGCKPMSCSAFAPSCYYYPNSCNQPVQCGDYQDGCGGTINCGSCPQNSFCSYGKCNLICQLPKCSDLGYQCGTHPLNTPGCESSSLVCGECQGNKQCVSGKCVTMPAQPKGWVCNPATGYKVSVWSPGANWEALTSGPSAGYYSGTFGADQQYGFGFKCDELPAGLLIHSGKQGIQIQTKNPSLPSFGVYLPFDKPLIITPSYSPDVSTTQLTTGANPGNVLVRIPTK